MAEGRRGKGGSTTAVCKDGMGKAAPAHGVLPGAPKVAWPSSVQAGPTGRAACAYQGGRACHVCERRGQRGERRAREGSQLAPDAMAMKVGLNDWRGLTAAAAAPTAEGARGKLAAPSVPWAEHWVAAPAQVAEPCSHHRGRCVGSRSRRARASGVHTSCCGARSVRTRPGCLLSPGATAQMSPHPSAHTPARGRGRGAGG